MSDVPAVTCPACHKSFSERFLSTKSFTIESCPYCRAAVREGRGLGSTNVTRMIAEDVAAIDTWLDNHASAQGVNVAKTGTDQGTDYRWSVETTLAWRCEIAYDASRSGFISFRLVSPDNARSILADRRGHHATCGNHGVEPFRESHSDSATGQDVVVWGAAQQLSTETLCEEQFEPILQRLDATMKDIQARIASM